MKKQKRTIWEQILTLDCKMRKSPFLALGYLLALVDNDIITVEEYKELYNRYYDQFSTCFS